MRVQQKRSDRTKVYDDASSKEPSLTVPDEAMSVPYLLSRYVQGAPLGVQEKNPINMGSDNFDSPDWEKVKQMDVLDHEEFRSEISEIEEAHKEQVKQRKAKKAEPVQNPPSETVLKTSVPEGTQAAP